MSVIQKEVARMLKILMISLPLLYSCSGGGGGEGSSSSAFSNDPNGIVKELPSLKVKLSTEEVKTKEALQAKLLAISSDEKYQVSEVDLQELVSEGLLTNEELKALVITQ